MQSSTIRIGVIAGLEGLALLVSSIAHGQVTTGAAPNDLAPPSAKLVRSGSAPNQVVPPPPGRGAVTGTPEGLLEDLLRGQMPGQNAPEVPAPPAPGLGTTPAGGRAPAAPPPPPVSDEELAKQVQIDKRGRVSLHSEDLDVRRALEIISREAKVNFLLSPNVAGRVTIHLDNATLDQALDAILKLSGLVARQRNGLIYIYTPDEVTQVDLRNQKFQTRVYKLSYIRSTDLMVMIQPLISERGVISSTPESQEGISAAPAFSTGNGGGGGGGGGGGSAGGGAMGSTGGNSLAGNDVLIVRDYEANLEVVDEVVRQLDVQPIQVLIEAVILNVDLTRSYELGVNFAILDNLGRTIGEIGNSGEMASTVGFTPLQVVTNTGVTAGKIAQGAVSGLSAPTNGVKFGFIGPNTASFIRALEQITEVNVLASPRLLVLNKQRADIQLGQRLGYRTLTQNLTSTIQQIQFLNTGTLLRLRPFVANDRMIRLEVHPERSAGSVDASGLPNQTVSEVTTNIMVPDGVTLVIGGLISQNDTFQYQGIPGLTRAPILSAIFGYRNRVQEKSELIVLLTPHIWDPNCAFAAGSASPEATMGNNDSAAATTAAGAVRTRSNSAPPSAPAVSVSAEVTRGPAPAASRTNPSATGASRPTRTNREAQQNTPSTTVARAPGRQPSASPARVDPGVVPTRYTATPAQKPRVAQGTKYSVRAGDTIQSIARDRLGDARRAQEILDWNRDTITDPRRLVPGQVLTLPDSR